MVVISEKISIPLRELEFSYTKSSGPGGQKVNKTNSCAVLTWNLSQSSALTEADRAILTKKLARRLTAEGAVVLRSDRFRDRGRNVADCVEKLRSILQKALLRRKKRVPTRPTKASKKKRLESKKKESEKKRLRAKIR